jgi:hypothetical protein
MEGPFGYNGIMDIKTQLNNSLKDAMRSNDDVRKRTIRMALAAIKQAEIDRQITLDEGAVISILQKEIRIRRESLEEAQKANRTDLVAYAEAEIDVLNTYLPEGLSNEELMELAKAVIIEVGATSMADLGRVMKSLMPRIQGRAPGDQVNQTVSVLLQK